MNRRWITAVLSTLLLFFLTSVVSSSGAVPLMPRWVIVGGGGDVASGNVRIQTAIGQAIGGLAKSGNVSVCSGFWCGGSRSCVFLPLTLRDYIQPFAGPWEIEPNNSYLQANGPLISGRDYRGYPNDERDYFSIYLRQPGSITIDLTGHTGQGLQLHLFYGSPQAGGSVKHDYEPPYQIIYNGQAGWYYVYIYATGGYNSTTPYTLRVTYPE